jgi:hypothetical protein
MKVCLLENTSTYNKPCDHTRPAAVDGIQKYKSAQVDRIVTCEEKIDKRDTKQKMVRLARVESTIIKYFPIFQ